MATRKKLYLGNFVVYSVSVMWGTFVYQIETRSGNWKMTAGVGSALYTLLRRFFDDKEMYEYLASVISMCYQMTQCIPDLEFMRQYTEIMNAQIERNRAQIERKGKGRGLSKSDEPELLVERARDLMRQTGQEEELKRFDKALAAAVAEEVARRAMEAGSWQSEADEYRSEDEEH